MIETSPMTRLSRSGARLALFASLACTSVQAQIPLGNFGNLGAPVGPSTGSSGSTFSSPANASGAVAPNGGGNSLQGGLPSIGGAGIGGNQLENNGNMLQPSQDGRSINQGVRSGTGGGSGRQNDGLLTERDKNPAPSNGRAIQQQPSLFQQFVQQSTGRLLPIYGEELFKRPEVYSADANGPVADDYVLGPGDDVKVQVWGGVNYDGTLTIDRNGQVNIPRAGVVTLAGVRSKDVESVLRSQLGNTFTNFSLNANLDRLRSIQVYVVGQAQQPGTYNLSSLSTLVNALFASGGPSANGSMRKVQLKRSGVVLTTLDLYDFIGRGDKTKDVALKSGDVIIIPPVGARVAITGSLDQAAIYELKGSENEQTSLSDILSLNGGVPVLATTRKALIERVAPGQNPPRQVQDLALDSNGLQQPLRDGDVITLLNISPAFGNAVTLQGNVAAPLRYRWFPGMKIRDLIPEREALVTGDYYQRKNLLVQNAEVLSPKEAGGSITDRVRGIVDQINWDYAVIERLDKDRLRTQLIPFSLAGAVLQGDETQNLTLEPGDVVTVLSERDLKLPVERQSRLVRLEGEVAAPGVYEALPGETLTQIIQRVGGLRPQAYVFGTQFDRVSVRVKQQENLDMLIRRLEQQQRGELLYLAANRPSDSASQAALFNQQQIAGQAQIAALRTLKSNGRISLELDPEVNAVSALPDVPLEDGDRIVVPPMPGFVSAVGAINNENVFVYRNGRTVADVLKSAGLRDEADKNLAFVLRADGSIVNRKDRAGLFGDKFDEMKLMPGDTVVVPEKLDRETTRNFVVRQVKDWTQILSQFGLSVAALKVLRDL